MSIMDHEGHWAGPSCFVETSDLTERPSKSEGQSDDYQDTEAHYCNCDGVIGGHFKHREAPNREFTSRLRSRTGECGTLLLLSTLTYPTDGNPPRLNSKHGKRLMRCAAWFLGPTLPNAHCHRGLTFTSQI